MKQLSLILALLALSTAIIVEPSSISETKEIIEFLTDSQRNLNLDDSPQTAKENGDKLLNDIQTLLENSKDNNVRDNKQILQIIQNEKENGQVVALLFLDSKYDSELTLEDVVKNGQVEIDPEFFSYMKSIIVDVKQVFNHDPEQTGSREDEEDE